MILAGDVGGTKTILGLFRVADGSRLEAVRTSTYASADYSGLESIITTFLVNEPVEIQTACFGIPGPVVAGRVRTMNLSWAIDAVEVSLATGIRHVELINDLMATAEGVACLQPHEFATLQEGKKLAEPGNAALVAPGTGLGMAILARAGDEFLPLASEGGHMDFAPRNEDEIGLLRFLQKRFGHVSVERVASGQGLLNIYEYLRESGFAPEKPSIREQMETGDPGAVIGGSALAGDCALCVKSLDVFASVLGATAGNLALAALATSGVFIGGGIPPKILPKLQDGSFLEAFLDKGRFSSMLESFPVAVIRNDRTALYGAARRASRRLCVA